MHTYIYCEDVSLVDLILGWVLRPTSRIAHCRCHQCLVFGFALCTGRIKRRHNDGDTSVLLQKQSRRIYCSYNNKMPQRLSSIFWAGTPTKRNISYWKPCHGVYQSSCSAGLDFPFPVMFDNASTPPILGQDSGMELFPGATGSYITLLPCCHSIGVNHSIFFHYSWPSVTMVFEKIRDIGWPTVVIAFLGNWIVYLIAGAVYRLYFSPLSKFPGPKLAALTLWYEFYYDVIKTGMYMDQIKQMHVKYGTMLFPRFPATC